MNINIKRKTCFLLILVSSLLSTINTYANLEGRWVQHPASTLRSARKQTQVDRIIEGNRFVYFAVRGAYSGRDRIGTIIGTYANEHDYETISIFAYEKSLPWSDLNIKPISQIYELSGTFADVFNYSPRLGLAVIIYDNASLDIVCDDGSVISSKVLADLTVPGQTGRSYSVTFDEYNKVAYIAGSFGVATLNLQNGDLVDAVITDKPVSWAGRVGDNMVLFAGKIYQSQLSLAGGNKVMIQSEYETDMYIFPVGKIPAKLANPIADSHNLQALMTVSDSSFLALAPGASDTQNILKLFQVIDGKVTSEALTETLTVDDAALWNHRHLFRTDGLFQNTSDGYVVHTLDNILLLKKNGTGVDVEKISKASLSSAEKGSKAATLDGRKLWLYTYDTPGNADAAKRGFYSYDCSDGSFSSKSEIAAPNGPTCSFATYATWNPEYGLLLRGPGSLFNDQETDMDRLCGYKDGIWTDYSAAARNPKYVLPTNYSKFVDYDPLYPNMVWGNTTRNGGVHRLDLDDPDNFFEFGSNFFPSYATTYPGYFPMFQFQYNWREATYFSNVDFDNDGNLWFARNWMAGYIGPNETDWFAEDVQLAYTPLYYLTPDERKQMTNIGSDGSKIPDILNEEREIRVPHTTIGNFPKLRALKAPQNANYLALTTCFTPSLIMHSFLYDHNGTLGNKDDDRYVFIDDLFDENGDKVIYTYETGIYEDMATGDLWLLTTTGPFIFNPSEILAGNNTCRRPDVKRINGVVTEKNPFEYVTIQYIVDDNLGRKWMATQEGLFCLSADNEELLGHYTTENSPLPSNNVFNVICTPEGAVFVLTDHGLAEFRPEGGLSQVEEGSHLKIWPSSINPSFKGYVNISGAETGSEYGVYTADGEKIASLGKTDNGSLQWHPAGLLPGRYNVRREGKNDTNTLIVLEK